MLDITTKSNIFQSLDIDGYILSVSPAWLDFSGYNADEVFGKHFTNFLACESHECMKKKFPQLKDYGKVNNVQLNFKHKNETFSTIILDGTSFYQQDGSFTHTICEIKTLEELLNSKKEVLKLLEQTTKLNEELILTSHKLIEEKRFLQMSENIANIGYWKTDYVHSKHVWSDELYRIFGYSPQIKSPSYKAYLDIVHPEDKAFVHKAFMDLIKRGIALNITHRGISNDGSVFYLRNQGQRFEHDNGEVIAILGTVFDVTQEINLQNELRLEKDKAEQAAQGKAQFLANMSHEIRTPMNAILGFVDILSKQETQAQKIEQFDIIKSSGNALLHIINDILDFSKIQSSKLHIEFREFNPAQAFKNSIMLYSQLAKDKKINFNYTISSELPQYCKGDEIRLKQIISNLISNAIKFTPENGYIQVNANYVDKRVYISVEDSGVGIRADKLEHIFKMFEQEDNSVTRNFGGTGLGLAISKELVEMMGGELVVRSQVGYGSHFNFNILLEPLDKTTQKIETVKDEHLLEGRVLLVEDNKSNQLLMSIFLEELGLEFDIANDGLEAVDKVKEKAYKNELYKAILMDENMPNMNGTQATLEIRKFEDDRKEKSIIIAVTANALSTDKEKFLDAGMDDYLSKPIDQEKLELTLRKYL